MQRVTPQFFMSLIACFVALSLAIGHEFINLKGVALVLMGFIVTALLSLPNKWGIRLFFVYVCFEGFIKVISNYHPVLHVGLDLLIIALVTKTIILMVLGFIPKAPTLPTFTNYFIVLWAWFLITFANPYALSLVASMAGAKVYVTMLLLFFFAYYQVKKDPNEVRVIMWIWIISTVIHALVSIHQFSIGPDSVIRIHPRYAQIWAQYEGLAFRPFGLTHLPSLPAVYIFLSTPFLIYFIFKAKNTLVKLALFSVVPLWIVVLLMCQTRSAILKSIVAGGIFVLLSMLISAAGVSKRKLKNVAFGVLAILVSLFIVPSMMDTATTEFQDAERAFDRSLSLFEYDRVSKARHGMWERLWRYAVRAPLGAGLSRVGAAGGKFGHLIKSDDPFGNVFFSDNFWLAVIVDLGIPGLIIISLLIGGIFVRSIRYLRRIPDEHRSLHLALTCGIMGSGLGMYGAEAMLYNPEAAYFWFFSGCLVALQDQASASEKARKQQFFQQRHSAL